MEWPWKNKRKLQGTVQIGNTAYSPEYLTLCAEGIKNNCKNTKHGEDCIFASSGRCDGTCTLWKNTPNFWSEKRWIK